MIAFSRQGAVYRVNIDGTHQTRLSPSNAGFCGDSTPDWSPDDSKIIFSYECPNSSATSQFADIYTMSAVDGSSRANLMGDGTTLYMEPHFSPDGTKVVMAGSTNGEQGIFQLYMMNANGSNVTRLTSISGVVIDPAWAPDGTKIAVRSVPSSTNNVNIWLLTLGNLTLTQLTKFVEPIEAANPSWSPDGRKIAFEWDNCTGLPNCQSQINDAAPAFVWTMNPDGSGQQNTGQACSAIGCWPVYAPTSSNFVAGMTPGSATIGASQGGASGATSLTVVAARAANLHRPRGRSNQSSMP
jgi:TolB protein